jgi:hypothetical protein
VAQADATRATAGAARAELPSEFPLTDLPLTDWTLRPFAATRLPAWVMAVCAAAAFAAASQGIRAAIALTGQPDALGLAYVWLDTLNGVLFAYIPAALWFLRCARLRDLRELRPALRADAPFEPLARAMVCPSPRRLALAGLAGAALLGVLPAIDPAFFEGEPPALASPVMLFFVGRMALTGWLSGRAVLTEVGAVTALSRIGERCMRVDLLDLRPFEVFARAGQRSAFAWVLVSSLVSLFWLGPGAGVANAFIVAAILVAVSLAFVGGLYGAHRSIAAARSEALRAVEARIAQAGATLMAGGTDAPGPRLADLVAWHAFLARVREWPVGAPVLARTALLAALAIGSWLGGALVERIVDRVFG